jgi:SAM-dependent MidA family methyltransferase
MTPARPGAPAPAPSPLGIPDLADLPGASAFLSSRWSRDSLVSSHPARLYDGPVRERIDLDSLEYLVEDLRATRGPFELGAARMGIFTWDIACAGAEGPFTLQVPLVLDERGSRGRAKREIPEHNALNMRHFIAEGLGRFVLEPKDVLVLGGNVPAALFSALPEHRPLFFGQGSLQLELADGRRAFRLLLGAERTADLLAELIAVLVYHYDPALAGGTALVDVAVNDGDFLLRRRADGSFDVRLGAARRREPEVPPNLLLLYLVQWMTYEDWSVDHDLSGLPLLISNPSIAFEGVVRGVRYRYRDLGQSEEQAVSDARRWIFEFGRSREGRSYRRFAERFLAGQLPLCFGEDLRERWWRLAPFQERLGLLELRGRQSPGAQEAAQARALRAALERLSREIGRRPERAAGTYDINDLDPAGLAELLEAAGVPEASRSAVLGDFFAHWPYRSLDQLLAQVPGARGLRRLKNRLAFGRVIADTDQSTLKSLDPAPRTDVPRAVANPEMLAERALDPELQAAATQVFATFEAYMDGTLHDERFGYYARSVTIGKTGDFDTHPESFSPDYGSWIAEWAFRTWQELVAQGELAQGDAFPIVEFGAGNGRLAVDVLKAVATSAAAPVAPESEARRRFADRVEYRIYEKSASLREKQRALLGGAALVAEGDARAPEATLKRDFPRGLRGFVVTNEVPDAFGFHKVVLTREGRALAALVVPRAELALCNGLEAPLQERIARADQALRTTFGFSQYPDERYLDQGSYTELMAVLAELPPEARETELGRLWFEELYVPAALIPELSAHLRENADEYATALAAEDSGVVTYVNLHAARFMRELGASLAAGLIVTIDYGDTTWALLQGARRGDFPFRVYRDAKDYYPRPNDPYIAPGTQDLTADVNFTELARAGMSAGLELIHFGPERDITGDRLPDLVRRAVEKDRLAKFLGNPVFKLLVLGKRPSGIFQSPLLTPLPLFGREQDVPKAQRQRIPALKAALLVR